MTPEDSTPHASGADTASTPRPGEPVVIRKYANRRLYNTATGAFVTLADLHEMTKREEEFVVREAKTDRDITASVLTLILAEEASRGHALLPPGYLRQLLRLYHQGFGEQLTTHLEKSMELFSTHQRDLARQMPNLFDPAGMLTAFRELGERNAEFLKQSASLFAPPGAARRTTGDENTAAPPAPAPTPTAERPQEEAMSSTPASDAAPTSADADAMRELRAQLNALQQRFDELERDRNDDKE